MRNVTKGGKHISEPSRALWSAVGLEAVDTRCIGGARTVGVGAEMRSDEVDDTEQEGRGLGSQRDGPRARTSAHAVTTGREISSLASLVRFAMGRQRTLGHPRTRRNCPSATDLVMMTSDTLRLTAMALGRSGRLASRTSASTVRRPTSSSRW